MKIKSKVLIPLTLASTIALTGCTPFDTPEFVTIEPNQTAFVIPLEGATSDQGQFESVEYLKKMQVATKRIQVPHKWIQKGRWWFDGEYIDTIRVIVVDRFPETREWKNTESQTDTAQGFVGESKDSIKFSIGISATAQILEEDTATFLYQYSGKNLKDVMDFEIRNKIGTVLLEKYGSMTIEEIRSSKSDVINHVRKEVEPYFKRLGITLSNIGYVGDLKYLSADVQESINRKFKEEQEQAAQAIANKTAIEKAQAEVEKAKAESQAVQIRQATIDAQIKLRELENQAKWIEKWDGKQPTYVGGNGQQHIINIPNQ